MCVVGLRVIVGWMGGRIEGIYDSMGMVAFLIDRKLLSMMGFF